MDLLPYLHRATISCVLQLQHLSGLVAAAHRCRPVAGQALTQHASTAAGDAAGHAQQQQPATAAGPAAGPCGLTAPAVVGHQGVGTASTQPCHHGQRAWHVQPAGRAAGWPASHGWTTATARGACSSQHQQRHFSTARTAARNTSSDQQADDEELALLASELLSKDQRGHLTPTAIVQELDKFIIGQDEAKRAVAVALRNRWRRSLLPQLAADEVMPKNILMVGPTGVGKTEIARRLAKLADAPFVKVEATKYTELGYVGRDVEDIIKDLVEAAQSLVRQRLQRKASEATAERVERCILNALTGEHATPDIRSTFRDLYRAGSLDNNSVTIDLPNSDGPNKRISIEGGNVVVYEHMKPGSGNKQKMQVWEARQRLEEAEVERMMSSEQVTREAIRAAEQDGFVFIDEIDKIVEGAGRMYISTGSVSGSGVQRDLLPIIEGSTVPTKYGNVNTDHILFICAGAFHSSKPSDMLAELQGRLPIRVALKGLTAQDFEKILTEPEHNMLQQQQALLATEGVELKFTDAAVKAVAQVAEEVNRMLDNIGARRLHTVLERILSDISFTAPDKVEEAKRQGQSSYTYMVDEEHVRAVMKDLLQKRDLSRYVL